MVLEGPGLVPEMWVISTLVFPPPIIPALWVGRVALVAVLNVLVRRFPSLKWAFWVGNLFQEVKTDPAQDLL